MAGDNLRGETARPTTKPVTKPHRWAEVLTCGVEMSKRIWITMMRRMTKNKARGRNKGIRSRGGASWECFRLRQFATAPLVKFPGQV